MTTHGTSSHSRLAWTTHVCAVLIATAATGCAARRPVSVADHFIKQGEPTIDLGGPAVTATTDEYVAQLRALAAQARPRTKTTSPENLETQDTQLRDALAALAVTPSAATHRRVALEYRRLGILDAAFTHASAAVKRDPKDAAAYDLRARIWRRWGLPQLGITDAKRAVALARTSATAWNTLGLLLEGSGSMTHAISAYLHAVRYDAQGAYAWSNLCRSWLKAGEGPAATQACRRTLALVPSSLEAQVALMQAEQMTVPRRVTPAATATARTLPGRTLTRW